MIKYYNRFLIIFLFIFLVKKTTGQISASISYGCAPLDVTFTPPAGMSTYYWDFDDGSSSEDASPTNKFINPKTSYKVSLRACKTCPILYTFDITVKPKPTVTMDVIKGCAPLNAQITPNYTLPSGVTTTSIKYVFGDGTSQTLTAPNLSPASHNYSNGVFPVTFEITTSPNVANCDNTVTVPDAIMASNLFVSINANPAAGCSVPFTTTFTSSITADRPIVSYDWDFGDAGTSSSNSPSHTYTALGSYTVKLTVKDDYGCEKTAFTTVIVKKNDLTKIISKDTVCKNTILNVSHDGNSGLNTTWSFIGASSIGNLYSKNSLVVYPNLGTYNITVTTSYSPGSTCPITVSKQITVINPKILFKVTPKPLCNKINTFTVNCLNSNQFDSITWKSYYLDELGGKVYVKVYSTQFNQTITDTIKDLDSLAWLYKRLVLEVEAVSKFGCVVTDIDTNFISPIIAHVVPTITYGCVPLRVGFYDKTTRYRVDTLQEWIFDFGDGTKTTYTVPLSSDTFYHNYTSRGEYNVIAIVKNKFGCFDTTYVTKVKVGTPHTPDFTISPNGGLCASDPNSQITVSSLVSNDSAQVTKFWVDGFQCFNQKTLTYTPSKTAGSFPIKMEISDNGCFSSVTKTITMLGPIAKFIDTQFCDTPKKVVFTNQSQESTNYYWDFGDGTNSTLANPTHYYASDGDYIATLIAYNSGNTCPADTYSLKVKIQTPLAQFDKDSFVFCHTDNNKIITAKSSSGYINDSINTGLIWEFYIDRIPFRAKIDTYDYNFNDTILDTVYLTVRNFMNCVSKDKVPVKIDRVDLSLDPPITATICPGDTVLFKGKVISKYEPIRYLWDFGDGDSAVSKDTMHQYFFGRNTNSFAYTFYVKNSFGCENTFTGNVITKKLGLSLSSNPNICLASATVPTTLTASTLFPCNISWLLPNGNSATGNVISYQFSSSGSYNFELYAVDVNNQRCKDTITSTVNVWDKPDYSILSNKDLVTTLCDPENIDLSFVDLKNTTLVGGQSWKIENSLGTNYFSNLTVSTPLAKGSNKVTFIAANQYCKDTVVRIFDVKAPSGKFTIDKNDICKGDEITFTVNNLVDVTDFSIDFGDGNLSNNISPVKHRYNYVPIGGQTKAKVIFATNINECIGQPKDTIIRIHEVFAKFGLDYNADTPICFRPVHIKDSSKGADRYQWTFGDGSSSTVKEPGFRNFPQAGTYPIQLNIENSQFGCKDTFRDTLNLIPKPISKPTNDTVCRGDTARLIQTLAQSNVDFYWNPPTKFFKNPTDTNYIYTDSSLNYTAIAISKLNGCADTAKGLVYVIQPMQSVRLDTILSPGQDFVLPFNLFPNYRNTWTPDSFLSCTTCSNPIAQYILNPIRYRVVFQDIFKNCFLDSSIYNIRIFPDILVNAPTAFTPNGDGINDIYYARGFGIKKLLSFKIYNRWGQLLFFSTSEYNGWDGNYKDVPQNSDVYYYTIEGEAYIKDKIVTKEGNFMLIR